MEETVYEKQLPTQNTDQVFRRNQDHQNAQQHAKEEGQQKSQQIQSFTGCTHAAFYQAVKGKVCWSSGLRQHWQQVKTWVQIPYRLHCDWV